MIDNFLKKLSKMSHNEKFNYIMANQSNFSIYVTVENFNYSGSWVLVENYGITLLTEKMIEIKNIDFFDEITEIKKINDPELASVFNRVFLMLDKTLSLVDCPNLMVKNNENNYYSINNHDDFLLIGGNIKKYPTFLIKNRYATIITDKTRIKQNILSYRVLDETIQITTDDYFIMLDFRTTELTIMFKSKIIFYGIDIFRFKGQ